MTFFIVLCTIFSDRIIEITRLMEIFSAVGLAIGPFIGSSVYGFIGYAKTMYLFASINVLTMCVCAYLLPNLLNEKDDD